MPIDKRTRAELIAEVALLTSQRNEARATAQTRLEKLEESLRQAQALEAQVLAARARPELPICMEPVPREDPLYPTYRKPRQPCGKPLAAICDEHLASERAGQRLELEQAGAEIQRLRTRLQHLANAVQLAEKAQRLLGGEVVNALAETEPNVEQFPGVR